MGKSSISLSFHVNMYATLFFIKVFRNFDILCNFLESKCSFFQNLYMLLTLICLENYAILIYWTSPFPFSRLSVAFFHFNFVVNKHFCKRRLIWVYTVCLGPRNGTLCIKELNLRCWIL